MRYSCATVSLYDLTPEQAVRAAVRAGFKGLEWKVGEAPNATTAKVGPGFLTDNKCTLRPGPQDAARVARLSAESGLAVVGLAPYLQVGDLSGLDRMFEMAVAAGAPQIRLQAPRPGAGAFRYDELAGRTVDYLAAGEVLARQSGVRLALEIHHTTIAPSASLAHALVRSLDAGLVGVIYDAGNLVWEGYEEHRIAVQILGPYLHHVHLKNAAAGRAEDASPGVWRYVWSPLDDGLVDVPAFLAVLASVGYDGWISLEDLSTERDPTGTLTHNAAVLAAMPGSGWRNRT